MADILDPTGEQLLNETIKRILPDPDAVPPSPGDLGPVVPLPQQEPPPRPSDLSLLNQQVVDQLQQNPLTTFRPYNVVFDRQPLPPINDETNLELAGQVEAYNQMRAMSSTSALPRELVPGNYINTPLAQTLPSQRWNTDYNGLANAWQERAQRIAAQAVPQNGNVPMIGTARSLTRGIPFSRSVEESSEQFFNRTSGVSIERPGDNEPVRPPSLFDRVVALPFTVVEGLLGEVDRRTEEGSVINRIGDAVQGVVNLSPLPNAEEVSYLRRIAGSAGQELVERAAQRIQNIGPVNFGLDLLSTAIPGGLNPTSSLARTVRQGNNPVNLFEREPQEFLGFYGTPQQPSFLAGVTRRSPELRNVLRDLSPVLDEAGRTRTNPFAGEFGDFGSAGSLSAFLYLANIPEGILTGALYDINDLVRLGTGGNIVGDALGRLNPIYRTRPPQENLERLDLLGSLYGRDYGFTQEFTEDRYLSAIGNPALSWLPEGIGLQTAVGFVSDMVVGGFADLGIETIVQRATVRTARQGREIVEQISNAPNRLRNDFEFVVYPEVHQNRQSIPINFGQEFGREPTPFRVRTDVTIEELYGTTPRVSLPSEEQITRDFMELYELTQRTRPTPVNELSLPPGSVDFYQPSRPAPVGLLPPSSVPPPPPPPPSQVARLANENVPINFGQRVRRAFQETRRTSGNPNLTIEEFMGYRPREVSVSTEDQIIRDFMDEFDTVQAAMDAAEAARVRGFLADNPPLLLPSGRTVVTDPPTAQRIFEVGVDTPAPIVSNGRRVLETITPDTQFDTAGTVNVVSERLRAISEQQSNVIPTLDVLNDRIRRTQGQQQADLILQRDNLRAVFDSLRQEDLTLRATLRDNASRNAAARTLLPAEAEANGVIINPDLDGSVIPLTSITPRVGNTPETMLKSRFAPLAVPGLSNVRRDDGTILSLAQMYGDIAPREFTDPLLNRLSNSFKISYLDLLDRTLYGRVGKSIPPSIADEVPRIRLGVTQEGESIEVVPKLPDSPDYAVPDVEPGDVLTPEQLELVRQELASTAKYHDSLVKKINSKLGLGQPVGELQARKKEAEALAQKIYSDYPQVAVENAVRALPDELRPVGLESENLAPTYVAVNQDFVREASTLQALKVELIEAEQIRNNQANILENMPRIERIDPITELETRRRFVGGDVPTSTHSKNKPIRNVAFPRSVEIPDRPTNMSVRQLQQALDNGERNPTIARFLRDRERIVKSGSLPADTEFTPVEGELRQLYRTVDNMSYREMQIALKEVELPARGNTDELRERLTDYRLVQYETTLADRGSGRVLPGNRAVVSDQVVRYFHGTKATDLDTPSTSLTNEFGPGLYVTNNVNEAYTYSIAQPADDLIDLDPDFRAQLTNEGRVFEIEAVAQRVVGSIDAANGPEFSVLDLSSAKAVDDVRNIFSQVLTAYSPQSKQIAKRFKTWAKSKHPRQYWHYVRSQYLRNGTSQLEYHNFTLLVQEALRMQNIDALKDGDVLNIISNNFAIGRTLPNNNAVGSIEEGLRARIAVDTVMHNRLRNQTTEAIVAQNQLALDTYGVNRLRDNVAEQERVTYERVSELGEVELELDQAVRRDTDANIQRQQDEGMRDANNQHNRVQRGDDICL